MIIIQTREYKTNQNHQFILFAFLLSHLFFSSFFMTHPSSTQKELANLTKNK